MRLVAFTFSISLPGVPESWESRSLGSLGSPGVLGVSGVPESQTVNCTFANEMFLADWAPSMQGTPAKKNAYKEKDDDDGDDDDSDDCVGDYDDGDDEVDVFNLIPLREVMSC